ncbi:uncharacterized protein LOC123544883 isoform X2 [Mercenaria mercenaria]|nr:uncharacterized protein LOC123544883 isoform X2 [Mercenaria mercenaria]
MEENVVGKPSLKTYSRAKNRRGISDDGMVLWQKAFQSQEKLSSPDDKESKFKKGKGKRERLKSTMSEAGSLKKLKQGRNKKAISQVKIRRKTSVKNLSPLQDSYENDVLFGKGLQPVKARQKSRARKPQAGTPKQKFGAKGQLKRSSVPKTKPQEQFKVSLQTNTSEKIELSAHELRSLHGEHASILVVESRSPPGSQLRPEDKVSDWLAKSDNCRSRDDSSKEVWRGEQQFTGDEVRNKLFPDEFFQNLKCVLQKPQSTRVSKHVKARQDEFLSQLALKNVDKQLVGGPGSAATEKFTNSCDESNEDITFIYSGTPSGLQTGTQTGTGTQTVTGTGSFSSYVGTGTSRVTETQSSCQTGTQMKTGTYSFSTSTGASRFKETETQSQTGTCTETLNFPTGTSTSRFTGRETQSHGETGVANINKNHPNGMCTTGTNNYTESIVVHTDTCVSSDTNTDTFPRKISARASSADRKNSVEIKDQYKPKTTEEERTFTCKDSNVPKYLCSTMRRSASLNSHEFPSELSAVTDCLKNQQQEEKTPRRTAEEFKVPGSPTKCTAFKGMRKGTLQPKNSTKLFTTGFVEIEDVIPQMSTITCEQNSKSTGIEDDKRGTLRPKQRQQNIKTSTPNKVNSEGQAFQFEIDISSVNMDSDDDLLHFNESREVNSDECIHLSDTLINTQQDRTIQDINADIKASRDGHFTKASTGEKSRKSAKKKEASADEDFATEISPETKTVKKDKKKTEPASKKPKNMNRKVPKRRKQKKFGGLKISLRNQNGRSRLSSTVSGTSWQSGYSRKSSTGILSTNSNDNNSKGKSKKAKDVCLPKNDVFDIDESAKNISVPEYKKLAKKTSLLFKKPLRKKALTVKKQQTKRKSGEISFNPKGTLNFNSISYSTLASESLGSVFHTYKQNSHRKTLYPPLEFNRNNYSYPSIASENLESILHSNRHNSNSKTLCPEPQKRVTVPVCTLMDEDFSCPRMKKSFVMFKTANTRSNQEILDSVQIDSLMM